MNRRTKTLLLTLCILVLALTLACGTVERSQRWADAEATRRTWAAEEWVPEQP